FGMAWRSGIPSGVTRPKDATSGHEDFRSEIMISRARRRIAVMTAVGCLVGLSPLATYAQEERPKETVRTAQAKSKASKQAKSEKVHKIAIQVAENNPQLMNLALNNANNIVS